MNTMPCTGDDDCPFCKMFGAPTKKKVMLNVIDHQTGKGNIMTMDESKYGEMIFKTVPKGRCWHIRLWNLKVTFWWMWRNLSWRDKRKGSTADFRFWMFGPWEFRRYW